MSQLDRAGLLDLVTADIWGWIILCCGGCLASVGCLVAPLASTPKMPTPYPLVMSPDFAKCPLRSKITQAENHGIREQPPIRSTSIYSSPFGIYPPYEGQPCHSSHLPQVESQTPQQKIQKKTLDWAPAGFSGLSHLFSTLPAVCFRWMGIMPISHIVFTSPGISTHCHSFLPSILKLSFFSLPTQRNSQSPSTVGVANPSAFKVRMVT